MHANKLRTVVVLLQTKTRFLLVYQIIICNFALEKTNIRNTTNDVIKTQRFENMIPYCGNCSRKTKKESLAKGEYYCDILADTPMKGIVTFDTDGTHCVELGIYRPIQKIIFQERTQSDNSIIWE